MWRKYTQDISEPIDHLSITEQSGQAVAQRYRPILSQETGSWEKQRQCHKGCCQDIVYERDCKHGIKGKQGQKSESCWRWIIEHLIFQLWAPE